MRILVASDIFLSKYITEKDNFILEVLKNISLNHPEIEFIFLHTGAVVIPKKWNTLKTTQVGGLYGKRILQRYWRRKRLPALLAKESADIFLSLNGLIAGQTSVKQIVIFNERKDFQIFAKEKPPGNLNAGFFSKKLLQEFLQTFSIKESSTFIIPPALPFQNSTHKDVEIGAAFFVADYSGATSAELILLLKSFSVFKKRQKTNWKLVLKIDKTEGSKTFQKSLDSYKYKDDITLMEADAEKFNAVIKYGYALIDMRENFIDAQTVLMGLSAGLPAIVSAKSAYNEIAGDAAIYVDDLSSSSIADKIMLIYKDETLRSKLSLNALKIAGSFSFEDSATKLAGQFKQK